MSTPRKSRPRVAVGAAALAAVSLLLASCTTAPRPAETGELTPSDTRTASPASPGARDPRAQYAGVLSAIPLAENEAGGTAFEVDDGDGGTWEVSVAVGADRFEVEVDADGTSVLRSERAGSVDDDDAAGLATAQVGLAEGIRIAIAEYAGTAPLDDASIDEDAGAFAWEVGFGDDIDIHVSVADGSILRVDGR